MPAREKTIELAFLIGYPVVRKRTQGEESDGTSSFMGSVFPEVKS
jgi:hypothetical protein